VSERQDSRFHKAAGSSAGEDASGERQPLDHVKAPREWRSTRASERQDQQPPRAASNRPDLPEPPRAAENPALGGSSESLQRQAPSSTQSIPSEAVPELPERYGEDRLVLLVRDPWWAYAWWEITDPTFGAARDAAGLGARFVLRVYNVSGVDWDGANHHSHFDIDVQDVAGNWFLELARPGDSFRAELGLLDDAGRFHCMVRSNAITLPPDQVSSVVDEEWMVADEEWQRLFEAAGGGVTMGVGSGEVLRMMEGRLHLDLSSGGLAKPPASGTDKRR
jgi:hypothetical protein